RPPEAGSRFLEGCGAVLPPPVQRAFVPCAASAPCPSGPAPSRRLRRTSAYRPGYGTGRDQAVGPVTERTAPDVAATPRHIRRWRSPCSCARAPTAARSDGERHPGPHTQESLCPL